MNRSADNKPTLAIKRVSSQADLVQVFSIRIRVFVREQRVPAEIELDQDDQQAIHFLAIKAGKAVGTARVVMSRDGAKIGRMAVLKSYRRRGIGAALLKRAILLSKRSRVRRIYLHAQVAVIGFYRRMGFRAVGGVFDEAGIAHQKMLFESKCFAQRHKGREGPKK